MTRINDYVRQIYARIVSLAMFVHLSYILIFGVLSLRVPMLYNIFSVVFYIVMQFVTKKGYYRLEVAAVHAEVALFVIVCTLTGAAGMDMKLYLLAMASIVYFCPYKHKYVPYIFAVCEIFVYVLLELYVHFFIPAPYEIQGAAALFLRVYNSVLSFGVILVSAILTGVSAAVTRKRLTDENRALTKLANYDQLTGLQSRHLFQKRVEGSQSNSEMVLCIGDIDDFKVINDTHGHVFGDYVLQKIAEIMRGLFDSEQVDICRWGGEEIILMFYDISLDETYEKVERLRKTISEYDFCHDNIHINVTMTFGIHQRSGKEDVMVLLDKADQLLYDGKTKGKNVVVKKVLQK